MSTRCAFMWLQVSIMVSKFIDGAVVRSTACSDSDKVHQIPAITGTFWGESIGHRFPTQRVSNVESIWVSCHHFIFFQWWSVCRTGRSPPRSFVWLRVARHQRPPSLAMLIVRSKFASSRTGLTSRCAREDAGLRGRGTGQWKVQWCLGCYRGLFYYVKARWIIDIIYWGNNKLPSNLQYKMHQIAKLKCISSLLAIVFA